MDSGGPGGRIAIPLSKGAAGGDDTSGENALVAPEFFYFVRNAIRIHARFTGLLATTQGHKNTHDTEVIERFWEWIGRAAPKFGRVGDPSEFDDEGCRAQCQEIEDDDTDAGETQCRIN
jgi:hypothetical protein